MTGGIKTLFVSAALLTTACASDDGQFNVRAIADPLAASAKPGTSTLGQARGLLALGSVGLALEGFHKALREQPDSIEALAGIAACYERMGRYDLSRAKYEAALAIAPHNAVLLNTFAASLAAQGRRAEAAALRAEAAKADAADSAELADAEPAQQASVQWTIEPAPAPAPARASTVTVALPPAERAVAVVAAPTEAQRPAELAIEKAAVQPRLERMSPGVVALLTGTGPVWSSEIVARTPRSVTMRFVAAKRTGRPNIRLLNAARAQGLAARSRDLLLERGWRKIEIGDASEVRERSLVLYPATRAGTGRSLAAQFGFTSSVAVTGGEFIVLLGRDAPDVAALRSRG